MIARFRDQHETMVGLAEGILAAAAQRRADDLSRLRLAFARAVSDHCRDEGAMVRDAVAAGTLCARIAAKHAGIVTAWRAEIFLCNSEWPSSHAADHPDAFTRRFRPLVDGLRAEVALEDAEILSVLENARPS